MKKALRMVHHSYFDEDVFERNLKLVASNTDVIDEITMFTEPTHHGYWTLEWVEKTASVLKDRIRRYKALGIKRVGLNVLCTIGHTEDGAAIAPTADMQYMMNLDGQISGSCLCPSDDRFIAYIAKKYALFADVGADFIWLDDDVRIHNHGVINDYCFCPECVKKFNLKYGTDYDTEQIRTLYREDGSFKTMWHESASDTMTRLFKAIRTAIHDTTPTVDIGFMSGLDGTIREWIDASGATLARPGGGFYNDLCPNDLFFKYFMMQQCVKRYPDSIRDIQYEYESYNFLTLQKSLHISELETSLMILSGCNGMLYNRWNHTQDFLDMMRKSAKKWDTLAELTKGCKALGVYCGSAFTSHKLNEIGIATTPYVEKASACFILGDQWDHYCDEDVERILHIGVYTDAIGFQKLQERGFEDLGGALGTQYPNGVWEHFTDHALNGDVESRERFVSLDIFHEADAYELLPEPLAEPISELNSAFDGLRGCSAYVYRRKEGAVIAVDGCLMPNQIQTDNKKLQMTNVFDMISSRKMPVVITKNNVKVVPTVTSDGERVNAMLVNAHFDSTEEFEVRLRVGKNFKLLTSDGELVPVAQRTENGETVVTVDNIAAWQYVILIGSCM